MTSTTSTTPRSPVREVVAYLAIAYSLALAIAVLLPHAHANLLLSVMIPTVTVGILTFTLFKRGARRELWRGIGLGSSGVRSWLPALFLPLLLCGAAYGTALLLGAGELRDINLTPSAVGGWAANAAVGLVVMTVVIMGEEIGWRGFLLPRVQQLTTRRKAAVVTGFLHGLFHLPLILIASTYDAAGARWIVAPVAVVTITAGGVFYAYLRDRSGSVWPVGVAHNSVNTVFDLGAKSVVATSPAGLAYIAGETGFATMGAVVAVAAVLLLRAKVWRTPADAAVTAETPQVAAAIPSD
jgi:membrane protease YdiL (CAAX protease family)